MVNCCGKVFDSEVERKKVTCLGLYFFHFLFVCDAIFKIFCVFLRQYLKPLNIVFSNLLVAERNPDFLFVKSVFLSELFRNTYSGVVLLELETLSWEGQQLEPVFVQV